MSFHYKSIDTLQQYNDMKSLLFSKYYVAFCSTQCTFNVQNSCALQMMHIFSSHFSTSFLLTESRNLIQSLLYSIVLCTHYTNQYVQFVAQCANAHWHSSRKSNKKGINNYSLNKNLTYILVERDDMICGREMREEREMRDLRER